ncbi:hypothetical protein [Saccharomonospora iraqiensis]|uniref:hypothetical protein n=1 Tax=Saccharomonospora iraqiensis TaxID=52698 RepID=UPI0004089520|nr:hypothetical protein [Saccharomonospora iraqiensis]
MTIDFPKVLGTIIVLAVVLPFVQHYIRSGWFRFVRLPSFARRYGWSVKQRMPWQFRKGSDHPASGSVTWDYTLPNVDVEILGIYGHRPVHAVQFSVRRRKSTHGDGPVTVIHRYSVVTVATSARPFDDFHGSGASRTVTDRAEQFYPDFVDWVRDRMPESDTPLRDEGPGVVSYSRRGHLTQRALFRALDELTEAG